MDAHKNETKTSEMKEQLVEGAKKTLDEAKDKLADAREKMNEEGSAVSGYKNKLVGQVKERVGHLFGIDHLEQRGHEQRVKGESVLAQHDHHDTAARKHDKTSRKGGKQDKSADTKESREALMQTFIRREALMAEVERKGGFEHERSHMQKVDLKERPVDVRDLFKGAEGNGAFQLKRWNKQALLGEIREKKTMKPLVVVQTQEKGLLRSLAPKDFALKKTDFLDNLWADIKRSDVQRLHKVSADQRSDRSAPRLELFRHLAAASEKRDSLLKDIQTAELQRLKHVETEDKTRPEMFFDKTAIVHRFEKARLLNELRQGAELKHVMTEDKSKPTIDRDTHVKTWDRQGFLDEVRIGTELKHL
jgi:uncharacterized protein YjbJ (UPF0337 family)